MSKTGLICAGGGMKGMYGCGILDYFIDNSINFDYCVAVSSGAANAAAFLAGQKGRNFRFYHDYPKNKNYSGFYPFFKTGSFFNLQYIYGELTDVIDPINYKNIQKSKTDMEIVATNIISGKAEYFSKNDYLVDNCKIIMASCAVPIICKPVKLNEQLYIDGGVAEPIPVDRCFEKDCDKIVCILPRSIDKAKKPENFHLLYKHFLKDYPNSVHALEERHTVYNNSLKKLKKLCDDGKAVIINPEEINLNMFSKNKKAMKNLYDSGVEDAEKKIEEIKEFIK